MQKKLGENRTPCLWLDLSRVTLSMNIVGLILPSGRFDLEKFQRGVRGVEGWMTVLPLTSWIHFQTWVSSTHSGDNINSTHLWDSCRDCYCCSIAKLCPTLCDPVDCSTPGSVSLTVSWSLPRVVSIQSVMPCKHLILCHPLLLLPKWCEYMHCSVYPFQFVGT